MSKSLLKQKKAKELKIKIIDLETFKKNEIKDKLKKGEKVKEEEVEFLYEEIEISKLKSRNIEDDKEKTKILEKISSLRDYIDLYNKQNTDKKNLSDVELKKVIKNAKTLIICTNRTAIEKDGILENKIIKSLEKSLQLDIIEDGILTIDYEEGRRSETKRNFSDLNGKYPEQLLEKLEKFKMTNKKFNNILFMFCARPSIFGDWNITLNLIKNKGYIGILTGNKSIPKYEELLSNEKSFKLIHKNSDPHKEFGLIYQKI